jgi:hypothetical protein
MYNNLKSKYVLFFSFTFLLLLIVFYVVQKKCFEGFSNNSDSNIYNSPITAEISAIKNPLVKVMKQIGALSTYLVNPTLWKNAYEHSKMSPIELARKQIAKDKKNSEK